MPLDDVAEAARKALAQLLELQPAMRIVAQEFRTIAATLELRGVPVAPALAQCDADNLPSFTTAVAAFDELVRPQPGVAA